MANFASLEDVGVIWRPIEEYEREKVESLLSIISNLIRFEGEKVGVDIEEKIARTDSYGDVVKIVVVAVLKRYMLESDDGTQMSQMSQSALGYSISGTYIVGGGGVKLLNNELKQLGLKKQRIGTISMM